MARATDWQDTPLGPADFGGGLSTNVDLSGGLTAADLRGSTIIRTIVSISLSSATVSGAWGTGVAFVGIGVASRDAFAATALPDPRTGGDEPPRGWIYRTAKGVSQNGVGTQVIFEVNADIRGARKLDNGVPYLIIDYDATDGTAFDLVVRGMIRLLIKLP